MRLLEGLDSKPCTVLCRKVHNKRRWVDKSPSGCQTHTLQFDRPAQPLTTVKQTALTYFSSHLDDLNLDVLDGRDVGVVRHRVARISLVSIPTRSPLFPFLVGPAPGLAAFLGFARLAPAQPKCYSSKHDLCLASCCCCCCCCCRCCCCCLLGAVAAVAAVASLLARCCCCCCFLACKVLLLLLLLLPLLFPCLIGAVVDVAALAVVTAAVFASTIVVALVALVVTTAVATTAAVVTATFYALLMLILVLLF